MITSSLRMMIEEKKEFVQKYFANADFQNFVNTKAFQVAVSNYIVTEY